MSLPRRMVSRDRSCFCFDRLSERLEFARARGMSCSASRAREQNRHFFSPLLPDRFQIPNHLGRTNCCCLPLESSNCRIIFFFCPACGCIEFLTLALVKEPRSKTLERDSLPICVEEFGEPEREFCANFLFFSFLFFGHFAPRRRRGDETRPRHLPRSG